jgi:hypothetical protein
MMTESQLREWLRENLLIDVERVEGHGPGNDVYVGLRFKGEDYAFSYERISIPERD